MYYTFQEYLIISIIHCIFLLGLFFCLQKIFKFTFEISITKIVIIGIGLGITLDIIAVLLFRFWSYPIENPLLYIFVIIGWYIPAVPLCIASMDIAIDKMKSGEIKPLALPFYFVEFLLSTGFFVPLAYWRIINNNTAAPEWFFPLMLVIAIFLSDSILGMLKRTGLVTLSLKSNPLIFFTPFIVGIVVGLFAESLNIRIPLYEITNTPESSVLDIPTFALVGWGIANLGYWVVNEFLDSKSVKQLFPTKLLQIIYSGK